MDVERTIEFILNAQAKAEIRADKADLRMDKIDKRLDSITKLMQQGMRILVRTNEEMAQLRKETKEEMAQMRKEFRRDMQELAKAQKATDRALKAFIRSMTHGRNGNN